MNELKALYYPYSRCLSEETLKRAMLVYDKLIFVDPMSEKVKQNRYSIKNHQQYLPDQAATKLSDEWEYIEKYYDALKNENFIELYDPSRILKNDVVDQLITDHLQDDMGVPGVYELFAHYPKSWSILRSRIPRSSFKYLHHQYTPRVFYDENITRSFANFGDEHHALFSDGKPDQEFSTPGYYQKRTVTETEAEYAAVVPFYLGSSLSVSTTLAIISENGAIPLTDSAAHHRLLTFRFQRAKEKLLKNPLLAIPGLEPTALDGSSQLRRLIEYRIIDSVLSSADFEILTLDDCLELREKTKTGRRAFQEEVLNISNQIESETWDISLDKEIARKINDLQKSYNAQQKESRKTFKEITGKAAIGAVVSMAPLLISSVIPGISAVATFFLGKSAVSGVLADPIKELAKTWLKSKPKNSLSFLYDIKRKAIN